jgi:cell division protein FtsI/penicillin-binding protein 2
MARRNSRLSWRLLILILFLAASTAGIVMRLVQVQILHHDYYERQAEAEHLHRTVVRAPRGAVLDRNGHPLATTVASFDIYVDPRSWEDDTTAIKGAAALAPVLGRDPAELVLAVRGQKEGDYLAARSLDATKGLQLIDEAPPGVKAVETSARYYPEGDIASTLLGFVGRDQAGLTGIESDFDGELGGVPAEVYFERDAIGNPIPFGRKLGGEPVPGGDVRLTIDRYIQRLVEIELDKSIMQHKATGGSIIVMDPKTGEVLAMASRPSFKLSQLNVNDPAQADLYRNRAVTDTYPPGSLMKTVTMATAIDLGLVSPNSTFYDSGTARVQGATIHNWDFSARGTVTATQILQYSLNTGAVWLSGLIGADKFYDYVARFGFGQATDVGLGGETPGIVRTNKDEGWCPCDLATNSYGQSIAATPLQVITAVSALVNGGNLMRPYIVKEVAGPDGPRSYEPVVVRRVVSPETSRTLIEMMNAVVEGSPGHAAQVPGYHVGGKTGTSTFIEKSTTIASFIGFAPVQDPRFVMLVKIDEPQDDRLGGVVAAPIFRALTPQILTYLGVAPDAALVNAGQ